MRISLNGSPRDVRDEGTLLSLLQELGIDPRRAAVALNSEVVPRGDLAARTPADGDAVEIIEAVGGG
jgi:thiamine biosynthesis protein ThiS